MDKEIFKLIYKSTNKNIIKRKTNKKAIINYDYCKSIAKNK